MKKSYWRQKGFSADSGYRSGIKGFFLLELLIATALLTAGITAVVQALTFCAGVSGFTRDLSEAVFLALDALQEQQFKCARGIFEPDKTEIKYRRGKFERAQVFSGGAETGFYTVDCTIRWISGKRKGNVNYRARVFIRTP